MNQSLFRTAVLLAAAVPLFGGAYSLTVKITDTDANVILPGTYQGSFTTSGTCTTCTIGNGIVSFDVPISTGAMVTTPTVLVFDAIESGTLPQFDTNSQTLSGLINMLQTLTTTTDPQFPSGTQLYLNMTSTTVGAQPTTCDSNDSVQRGCVIISDSEGAVFRGTYTITVQPGVGGCPATIGFWKHHPFPNSVQSSGLTIGGMTYSASDLLKILNANGGNAVVILGRQLVGALLNLAAGGLHNSAADTAIATSQSLLQANSLNFLTSNVPPSTSLGQQLTAQSAVLDGYNSADNNTCREGSGLTTGSK